MRSIGSATVGADVGSYTVVDVETTGLRAAEHRVLSVAALTLDGEGQVIDEFHTLLDPGCDPGPVHIHGLTREILRGAPVFDQVRDELGAMLAGRVMVAHNAHFDYGFLAREFHLAGGVLPVARRLCTLALARRVGPPIPNCTLGALAAHYGVRQSKAHDALDDARVLAGVLRALILDATRLGIHPPTLDCPPKSDHRGGWGRPVERRGPKQPCPYHYPGRWEPSGPLTQGMKIAFTGDSEVEREVLVARAETAGLDVTGAVSGRTSLLVANRPDSASTKARNAVRHRTPIVDERTFLGLLSTIRPGRRKDEPPGRPAIDSPRGPLAGRRILVLGGGHDRSAAARRRITELGGSAAVNLSANVTDVLALPGAESDRRMTKVRELGVPVHGPELLDPDRAHAEPPAPKTPEPRRPQIPEPQVRAIEPQVLETPESQAPQDLDPRISRNVDSHYSEPRASQVSEVPESQVPEVPVSPVREAFAPLVPDAPDSPAGEAIASQVPDAPDSQVEFAPQVPETLEQQVPKTFEPRVLARGQVTDLPVTEHGFEWTVRAAWGHGGSWEVDLVAFLVDEDERVDGDADFVFYNQPETSGVRLRGDGLSEQAAQISLTELPDHCRRVVVAAALDGEGVTFGDVGAIEIEFAPGDDAAAVARATLDAATEERTLLLAEIYLRGATWRVRAVGQGYAAGLAELARGYGVDVAD